MDKLLILILTLMGPSQILAMCIYSSSYYPGKADLQQVLQQANDLEIDDSVDVDRIIAKKTSAKIIKIIYASHDSGEYYSSHYELRCEKRIQWQCNKTEVLHLRFDLQQDKNIVAVKAPGISAGEYVEAALAANNQRPMSWYDSMFSIEYIGAQEFRAVFGKHCGHKSLFFKRIKHTEGNQFLVHWDNINDNLGCLSTIGCSNDSRFIVYENCEIYRYCILS